MPFEHAVNHSVHVLARSAGFERGSAHHFASEAALQLQSVSGMAAVMPFSLDAARFLPPTLLLSSCTDLTVPWCAPTALPRPHPKLVYNECRAAPFLGFLLLLKNVLLIILLSCLLVDFTSVWEGPGGEGWCSVCGPLPLHGCVGWRGCVDAGCGCGTAAAKAAAAADWPPHSCSYPFMHSYAQLQC